MTKATAKTSPCSPAEARVRVDHAEKFLEVADLVAGEQNIEASGSVAASLAILAGIAASDAACCKALGVRSRSQNHHDAEGLLAQVEPGGKQASNDLRRLLNLKDTAQYGLVYVSRTRLRSALKQARSLVEFGAGIVAR